MPASFPDERSPAAILVAALADPAVVVDQAGRVLAWNDAAGTHLGITARASGVTLEELGLAHDASGATRLQVMDGSAGRDATGAVAILVWRPAASLDPVDLELQRARAVARIAPGVAHDVSNKLAGVNGFASLLRDDPAAVAEYGAETLALLEASGHAAMSLVRAFVSLTRDGRPGTEGIAVGALLDEVLLLVAHRLTDVRCTVDVPADLPEVEANRAGLRQALTGIAVNSLEALGLPRPTGTLEVRARQVADGDTLVLELTFEDDAPTVPAQDRAHLFDARPPVGCTSRAGLDLAVARRLLEAGGGALRYEAGADGRNRLVATLRAAVAASPAAAVAASSARVGTADEPVDAGLGPAGTTDQITVLVCDDEQGVGRLTARLLERAGIRAVVAVSGAEALAAMDREPVDAVVTDQAMRGMSGVALHAAVSERHPRLRSRFVLVSGDPADPVLVAFARSTGVPVLGKPYAAAELVDLVREVARG